MKIFDILTDEYNVPATDEDIKRFVEYLIENNMIVSPLDEGIAYYKNKGITKMQVAAIVDCE